jgi:hypothetical protein
MIIFKSIILSSSILSYETIIDNNKQIFYFDGDYSQVAKEYYNKKDNKNDSNILYDVIAKEIEEGKHNLD